MKIKKLYESFSMTDAMVLQSLDGKFYMFYISPFRTITEEDLHPLPAYIPRGRRAAEAQPYMYKLYNLQKSSRQETRGTIMRQRKEEGHSYKINKSCF